MNFRLSTFLSPKQVFWLAWFLLLLILALPTTLFRVGGSWGLSLEWILLGGIMAYWPLSQRSLARWSVQGLYLLLLFWQCYRVFSWRLYQVEPNFFHDWSLFTEVLPIFWSELSLGKLSAYLPLLLGAGLGVLVLGGLLRMMVRSATKVRIFTSWEKGILAGCVGILVLSPWFPFTSFNFRQIWHSVEDSTQLKAEVLEIDPPDIATQWPDSLTFRPNIYLLFIESYGRVLDTDPVFQTRYREKLSRMQSDLEAAHWFSASAWSTAPISGGRSWLAFTSFLTGKRLYAHPQYTHLLEAAADYPHLIRFFNQQGYYTLRMNTLAAKTQSANIPYERYDRFFAFDRWLREPDIPYSGPAYGKFGSLPDQYALGYAVDSVIRDQSPFLLFFITLNSHSPWNDVPVLTDHWSDLEQLPDTAGRGQETSLMAGLATEKYWNAMAYQLSVMEKVVLQQGDSNSLFLLIGDHQPPFIADLEDSFETPVHLITQNPALMQRILAHGFPAGMHPAPVNPFYLKNRQSEKELKTANLRTENQKPGLHHQDFYALLLSLLQ